MVQTIRQSCNTFNNFTALANRDIKLGNITTSRDYTYVKDLCAVFKSYKNKRLKWHAY